MLGMFFAQHCLPQLERLRMHLLRLLVLPAVIKNKRKVVYAGERLGMHFT